MRSLFILFFLLTPFVPYFGTIDKIGSQWLFLSSLNLLCFFININKKDYPKLFFYLINFSFYKFYIAFIFFSFVSIFYANNFTLSFVDFSRILTTFFLLYNFVYIISVQKIKLDFLIASILVIDLFVILYSYMPLFEFVVDNSYYSIDFTSVPNALRGPTGNKNVLASYLVFNSVFAFYLISHKNIFYKFLSFITITFTAITIIFLSSRASIISFSLVTLTFFLYYLFKYKSFSLYPVLLLIVSIGFTSFIYLNFLPTNFNIVNKVQSINQSDTSTNFRIILWENAIDFITNNPIIGCGIGNWKIESLPYWKDRLTGYTIPYHAHNDFLELSTEIGLLGGLSYLFIFVSIFYSLILNIRKNSLLVFSVLSLLFVYFFDALVNFPLERAVSQLNFALLLFFLTYILTNNEKSYT